MPSDENPEISIPPHKPPPPELPPLPEPADYAAWDAQWPTVPQGEE